MRALRVLVVDDSATIRLLLPRLLGSSEDIAEVKAVAGGEQALQLVLERDFDVVLLDQEMPGMDGLETLDKLQATRPRLPVVMFSALTQRGARLTLDALTRGARTYVTKPSGVDGRQAAMEATREQLLSTILALFETKGNSKAPASVRPEIRTRVRADVAVQCVVIASSTGGPNGVTTLVEKLPNTCQVPVLIAQHMPPIFTTMFAARLDKVTELSAKEAYEGATTQAAMVWVAPGDSHLVVKKRQADGGAVLGLDKGPRRHGCRPSADTLFESAVEHFGAGVLGIVLSGMGKDGLAGCEAIVAAGGGVLAQDEQSSVVWSMPGCVARAGLAEMIGAPGDLAAELHRRLAKGVGAFGAGR